MADPRLSREGKEWYWESWETNRPYLLIYEPHRCPLPKIVTSTTSDTELHRVNFATGSNIDRYISNYLYIFTDNHLTIYIYRYISLWCPLLKIVTSRSSDTDFLGKLFRIAIVQLIQTDKIFGFNLCVFSLCTVCTVILLYPQSQIVFRKNQIYQTICFITGKSPRKIILCMNILPSSLS